MPRARTKKTDAARAREKLRGLRQELEISKTRMKLQLAQSQQDAFDHARSKQLARRVSSFSSEGDVGRKMNARGYSGSYASTRRDRLKDENAEILAPADSHLDQSSLDRLRRDSHDLYRNNVLARSVVGRICDAVCGPQGPNIVFASANREFSKKATDLFWKWANNEAGPQGKFDSLGRQTLMQGVRAIPASWLLDGDLGIVRLTNGSVRMFEGVEIRNPTGFINPLDRKSIVNGIEYDSLGAPTAIYVSPWKSGRTNTSSTKIPWDAVTLMVNPVHRRLNQTRGEPGLAALAHYLELIDDLLDSTTLAARAAAYAAIVLTLDDPAAYREAAIAQTLATNGGTANPARTGAPQQQVWEPLSVLTLKKGETATQIDPKHPTQQLDKFVRFLVRYACADVGCPLELAMLDSTETNYHGFKSAVGNAYRGFSWQQYNISETLTSLAAWRTGLFILEGLLDAPDDWDLIEWKFAGPPIIDPLQEIRAATLAWDGKNKLRSTIIGDLGYTGNLQDFNDQLRREQADLKDIDVKNSAGMSDQNQSPAA